MTTAYNLNIKHKKSILSCRCTLAFVSFVALLIILPLSPKSAYPAQTTLVWDPVIHPDVAGYMVYYGTSSGDYDVSLDVGNWTSVTIAGLDGSKTYYFAATAYSTYGEESNFSNEVSWSSTNTDYDAGDGGGCFIATAAYGSAMEPYVKVLREFRNRYLLTNSVGKTFVQLEYEYSQPIADLIAKQDTLRAVVRLGLLPIIGVSWMALKLGLAPTVALLALLMALMIVVLEIYFRKVRLLAQKA